MTHLSVNINKVAFLRNSRHLDYPSVIQAARIAIEAGAVGITIHPRPDERHIRFQDALDLAALWQEYPQAEFNIEGNPFEGAFMQLVSRIRPTQCTLVPDSPGAFTSDQGWQIAANQERLGAVIQQLQELGSRVSLFMDAGTSELELLKELGADRIEIYTEPFASAFQGKQQSEFTQKCQETARQAQQLGMGVNAGHDLSLQNLAFFLDSVPGVLEVSIGHALIADAIFMGLEAAVKSYLQICSNHQ